MPLYSCIFCNVSTNLKANHKRHLLTNKHYKNVKKCGDNMEKTNKMSQKEPKRAKISKNMQKKVRFLNSNNATKGLILLFFLIIRLTYNNL